MGAKLISLEQIDCINLTINVEVPGTEHVVSQTVDWLIGKDLVEWIQVVEQAGYCQGCL